MDINITLKNGEVLTCWGNCPDVNLDTVQSYSEEFMNSYDTLMAAGWHQLRDNLLVVVTDFVHTDGSWHKMYQVFCEGPFTNMEHRILLNKMYGWKMNKWDLPAIKN